MRPSIVRCYPPFPSLWKCHESWVFLNLAQEVLACVWVSLAWTSPIPPEEWQVTRSDANASKKLPAASRLTNPEAGPIYVQEHLFMQLWCDCDDRLKGTSVHGLPIPQLVGCEYYWAFQPLYIYHYSQHHMDWWIPFKEENMVWVLESFINETSFECIFRWCFPPYI